MPFTFPPLMALQPAFLSRGSFKLILILPPSYLTPSYQTPLTPRQMNGRAMIKLGLLKFNWTEILACVACARFLVEQEGSRGEGGLLSHQSAKSMALGTVALSITIPMWGGSMMMTYMAHGAKQLALAVSLLAICSTQIPNPRC